MKIGIFFGGPSREREASFAIGRTVYEKLDRSLFEPIPLFIDSYGQLVRLDWRHLYKRGIRDFFPPAEAYPESSGGLPIYQESLGELTEEQEQALLQKIGTPLAWEKLPHLIDFAFNAYLGLMQDGRALPEHLAEWNIPCTGSSAKVVKQATNRVLLGEILALKEFPQPKRILLHQEDWQNDSPNEVYQNAIDQLGSTLSVRPAQATAGVSVFHVGEKEGLEGFELAVNRAFFREVIPIVEWQDRGDYERREYLRFLVDLKEGLGFPIRLSFESERATFHRPEDLLQYMNERAAAGSEGTFELESEYASGQVLVEEAVNGRAFSCTVLQRLDGGSVPLVPMLEAGSAPLSVQDARQIQQISKALFETLEIKAFAEIRGVIDQEGAVFIQDCQPVLRLVPDNLIFAPAADISLSPTGLLTQMIRVSIAHLPEETSANVAPEAVEKLDHTIARHREKIEKATVLLDQSSLEDSKERLSSQHIFELLDAAVAYAPALALQSGDEGHPVFEWVSLRALYGSAAKTEELQPLLDETRDAAASLTQLYSNQARFDGESTTMEQWTAQNDVVFIAGEDVPGWLRRRFVDLKLPYSGTPPQSAELAADRYGIAQTLRRNGLSAPAQLLLRKKTYEADPSNFFTRIESQLGYPIQGGLTAREDQEYAKILNDRAALEAYTRLVFRPEGEEGKEARRLLRIRPQEHFPRRDRILFEVPIESKGAKHFLEIRAGMLTHYEADGSLRYEIFEPGERLPKVAEYPPRQGAYLSADGRSLSPARFSERADEQRRISLNVRKSLERAARTLGLQAYAVIEGYVRVYEDLSVDTVVSGVDTMPSLAAGECFFQQAVHRGYTPETLMRAILVFGQDRLYYNNRGRKGAGVRPTKLSTPTSAPVARKTTNTKPTIPTASQNKTMKEEAKKGFKPQSTKDYLLDRVKAIAAAVWGFLSTPFVLRNLVGIIAMVIGSVFLVRWSLQLYTSHGESVQIPNYVGMDVRDAARKAEKQDFKVVVIDSFFDSNQRPNVIYQQSPEPLQRAKKGRTIYVSKYRMLADSVTLPTFISASYDYDQYSAKLKRRDIKAVIKERVFAKDEPNTIQYLLYNGRKVDNDMLRRGMKVPKGSTLEFVVTERITNNVALPNMICKPYDAAAFLISSANLVIKETVGAEGNEQNAYVYRQEPPFQSGQMVPKGSAVTLYLTESRPVNCPEEDAGANPLESGEEEDF
jgi:D-alanine-D-alanine ligase